MKIAYIILAHRLPTQLARLVGRLDAPSVSFFVHIDGNTDDATCSEMHNGMTGRNNVHFLPRYPCPWSSWNVVLATLEGLEQVIRANLVPDYVILLSGQDYPLKTPEAIAAFLTQHRGTEFLDVRQLPDYTWNWHGAVDRFGGQPLPSGMEPFGGEAWWALSGECAAYVKGVANGDRDLIRLFEGVGIPTEHFFQTIVANSPFRDRLSRSGVHYVDWERGPPKVLGVEDFGRLSASPALFARKFDMTKDSAILDMIDAHLTQGVGAETQHDVVAHLNADALVEQPVGGRRDKIAKALRKLRKLPHPAKRKKQKREREYLEDLMAAVRAAQEQGLADNSPEMVEAVRADLEPTYGTWANFEERLPRNIERLLRIRAEGAARPMP